MPADVQYIQLTHAKVQAVSDAADTPLLADTLNFLCLDSNHFKKEIS